MRVFILGNGPSLADVDLSLLKDEYIIGCNRIHLHPTYRGLSAYCLGDKRGNTKHYRQDLLLHLDSGIPVIASWNMFYPNLSIKNWVDGKIIPVDKAWWDYPNLHPILQCEHYDMEQYDFNRWHFPHICTYGGSVHIATQWAVKNIVSLDEIYFLGVDANYGQGQDHFSTDYDTLLPKNVNVVNATIRKAHRVIEKECNNRNIKCYNLSEISTVSAHKKAKLENIL